MAGINENQQVGYYNKLPAIRSGGGVLIFNQRQELLIVKPNYRNTWAWPGGGCEPGESPLRAAIRECIEEIGRCPLPLVPAFVNYIPPRSSGLLDSMQFAFTPEEPVADDFIDQLIVQAEEIEAVRFVAVESLGRYLKEYRVRALHTYLAHRIPGALLYLEDGSLV